MSSIQQIKLSRGGALTHCSPPNEKSCLKPCLLSLSSLPCSQIHSPPEFTLYLNPQKSMRGSVKDQRPVSIKLHAKYPIDYPDRPGERERERERGEEKGKREEKGRRIVEENRGKIDR